MDATKRSARPIRLRPRNVRNRSKCRAASSENGITTICASSSSVGNRKACARRQSAVVAALRKRSKRPRNSSIFVTIVVPYVGVVELGEAFRDTLVPGMEVRQRIGIEQVHQTSVSDSGRPRSA